MKKRRIILVLLIGLLIGKGMLIGQAPTGKIVGKVTDSEGSALPGVTVEATSPKMVGRASAITDANGIYRLLALPPGTFKITYSLEGFSTVIREDIILSMEQTLTVDILMTLRKIQETVTVTGQSPLIDVKNTVKAATFSRKMFESLPKGRSFDTIVTAIPGVNAEVYAGGISTDGASGSENMFYIDGTDVTNALTGVRGQDAVFDLVDEVQVKASGYNAEFGGSLGGVINVITRSGGNEYHSELTVYYSGSRLRTKERDTLRLGLFDTSIAEYVNYQDLYGKDKQNRYEVGFNFGGYILKNKMWFFTSFLPVFQDTTRHVVWVPAGSAANADFTQNYTYWNANLKITTQPFKNVRISAGIVNNFSKYRGDLPSREGISSPTQPWSKYGYDYPNWSSNLTADYTLGNNLIVSARGGYFHKNQNNQQIQPTDPRYRFYAQLPVGATVTNSMFKDIPADFIKARGWANIGANDIYVMEKDIEDRASASMDVTYYMNLAGEHSWKAGVQMVWLNKDIDNSAMYENINLGWDREFQDLITGEKFRGKYGYYAVEGGTKSGAFGTFGQNSTTRWAVYLQDSWTPDFLKNRFTLNLGVRVEKEDLPSFYSDPNLRTPPVRFGFDDKIAPRVGFVYDVFGNADLKFFGSFGLYYDVMKLDSALSRYGARKWWSDYYTLDDWDWTKIGKGNYPGTYLGSYNWRTGGYKYTEPDMKPISESEYSFGAEKKLSENLSASVRVVYKHLINTIEDIGIYLPGIGEQYYQANPGLGVTLPVSQGGLFSDEFLPCPKAKREYWAVNFSLDKRFSKHWFGGISYTWSRLYGNYSGLASSDEWGRTSPNRNGFFDSTWVCYDKNVNLVYGLLNTDRPHQFKAFGSYAFDFGLTMGLVLNGMSGTPKSRELNLGNGSAGYFPDGRFTDGRTAFRFLGNAYAEYNLKVTDRYRVQISLNVDNIFDAKTPIRVFNLQNQGGATLSNDERLKPYTYSAADRTVTTYIRVIGWTADPRYLMDYAFSAPREARVGLKFIF